jgi:uncharacterized protein YdcH (DUF465 family)
LSETLKIYLESHPNVVLLCGTANHQFGNKKTCIGNYLPRRIKPMSTATSDTGFKDFLLSNDDRYRELASEHRRYEERLRELSGLHYPSEEEKIEETILKKKKLLLKDQMEAIALRYKPSGSSH